ncbi:MAG: hypothetical protein JWO95_2010 [Verrucomicrobiales bacterium]|nr:hypothetical protein [Verrucomicrobiales bacterium]
MFNLFTFGVVAVLLLTAYLYVSIDRRLSRKNGDKPLYDVPSKPIDVSSLTPTIKRLRENPSARLHFQPQTQVRRSRLIAAAKGIVTDLEFFRHRQEEHASHNQ